MATQIKSWQIVAGELKPIDTSLAEQGKTETYDLESWIASDPSLIGPDLRIIGRQVSTASGPLDLLGIDRSGNLAVIELKRDLLPREALAQAIDYASDVSAWDVDKISEVCVKHTGKSLDDFMSEEFPEENLETLNINSAQRIILVGFAIESALERMIQWLSDTYSISVNAILLHYHKTASGEEVVSRTTVISEEVAEKRAKAKKFQIPMSDEPGSYEEAELRKRLIDYLSQDRASSRSIRGVLLPACLEHSAVQRELLKDELVKRGIAKDVRRAGYHLSVVSGQIGMAKNDFLRQVIAYDYPNYPWEKDNYRLRPGSADLVREILAEVGAGERVRVEGDGERPRRVEATVGEARSRLGPLQV